jgi:hypothetical protein
LFHFFPNCSALVIIDLAITVGIEALQEGFVGDSITLGRFLCKALRQGEQ